MPPPSNTHTRATQKVKDTLQYLELEYNLQIPKRVRIVKFDKFKTLLVTAFLQKALFLSFLTERNRESF